MAWEVILPALASLAGGALAGQGANAAGEAEAAAAASAGKLSKDIYYDQRGLARPGYVTGGAATNKLGALFGIAPQNYEAAFAGANSGAPAGTYTAAELGAGQPVAGHSGGGGRNALSPFLIRNGGDNWQTLQTEAQPGYDFATYMQQPDLAKEWSKPDVQSLFGGNQDAYADWHYKTFGKNEGRTLNPIGGNTQTPQPTGGTQLAGQSSTTQASDPMADFMSSPYNKLATEATELDFGKIKGQLGAAGKSISGAGEARYAKTLAGNRLGAFDNYTNSLRSLAGMNQVAGSQISSAAGQYGQTAGNAMMAGGQAKGNALAGRYQGIGQGVAGALGTVQDYGQKAWGW
jgi:hypothetical protein